MFATRIDYTYSHLIFMEDSESLAYKVAKWASKNVSDYRLYRAGAVDDVGAHNYMHLQVPTKEDALKFILANSGQYKYKSLGKTQSI